MSRMMIRILKSKSVLRLSFQKYCSSILYVSGDKASKQVSIVSPYLDFDRKFYDIKDLEQNVKLRKIEDVNVKKLQETWEFLKSLLKKKELIENRRVENSNIMKQLTCSKEIEKYRHQGKMFKEEYKQLMQTIWAVENKTIPNILKLPNDLHSLTPHESANCIFETGKKLVGGPESHIEIGDENSFIDWRNASCYYLLDDAASYERYIFELISQLLKDVNFLEVSNSDFAQSVVLEGCNLPHNENISFQLTNAEDSVNENRLHLVGSASLASFCSLHAKQTVHADSLPLKYFTLGRLYKPSNGVPKGLFNSWQESAISIFVATCNYTEMISEYEKLLQYIIKLYEKLNYHFRVVYVPANELHPSESLRASIQMYSPHLKSYIEVGNLSIYGSFISKRLLMCFENNAGECGFLNILSGTILSGSKFIACALENDYYSKSKLLDEENISIVRIE